ncbi:cell division protein FtsL [Clostridium algoriphilum]|uniref:cell division protein FtsL n=1 Tax=Clostridium algoriphilum TaxID=198347 RepID=UPI001CF2369C|nr:cell division protein FtsL [Clostridium algoriphilum]MCB2291948.1 cell division protein FtsL [Clostridium algoriphilum]
MIIEKNKFRMDGNTVLVPDEPYKKRKYEDLEKSRSQVADSKKLRQIKKKKSVLTNIVLGFVVGIIIVARYCIIYNYQQVNSKAKNEIEVLNKENDSYAVDLIKFRNISYIEETATKRLHMVKPKVSDIQYLNLSKNNLQSKEDDGVKTSNDVVTKIKNIIF